MSKVKNYLSLIKFSHTIFAMPFALIGFFLGIEAWRKNNSITFHGWYTRFPITHMASDSVPHSPSDLLLRFLLVILCMITARSAAMSFNRYLDRSFDAKNPRTAIREIPRGIISANHALIFTIISCLIFFVSCLFINRTCFLLSPVALFI